jgi:hypothetical protein
MADSSISTPPVFGRWSPWLLPLILLSVFYGGIPALYIWPIVALNNHVLSWPIPVGYLVVVTGIQVAAVSRSRLRLRVGDDGLVIRNLWRSWRIRWPEVRRLVDGRYLDEWALTVLLRNGRAVTAQATQAELGHPATLSALKHAAAAHALSDELTGSPAERPYGWLDTASVAARYKRALAICRLLTGAVVAGLSVLSVWNAQHKDYGPVFLPVADLTLVSLIITIRTWHSRRKAMRPAHPPMSHYSEGAYFVVPLRGGELSAVGVVARTPDRVDGPMLGYLFAPFDTAETAADQLRALRPAHAVLIAQLKRGSTGAEGSTHWPLLGRVDGWDRADWPVPQFIRNDKQRRQSFKVSYDDRLRFVREVPATGSGLDHLSAWEPLASAQVTAELVRVLGATRSDEMRGYTFPRVVVGFSRKQVRAWLTASAFLLDDELPPSPPDKFARVVGGFSPQEVRDFAMTLRRLHPAQPTTVPLGRE